MSLLAKTSGCPRRPVETRGQELDTHISTRRAHTRQRGTIPGADAQVKTPPLADPSARRRRQRRRTHCMHRRAAGSASSLIAGISLPHRSQEPYVPAVRRETAASISRISDSVSVMSAAIFARSNAIVDPSGSCSSSSVVNRDPSITDASSARRDASRCSARDRSTPSTAPKSVTAPSRHRDGPACDETTSAPTDVLGRGRCLLSRQVSEPSVPCWPSRRRASSRHRCGRPRPGSTE